jgi:hypothetical protein
MIEDHRDGDGRENAGITGAGARQGEIEGPLAEEFSVRVVVCWTKVMGAALLKGLLTWGFA